MQHSTIMNNNNSLLNPSQFSLHNQTPQQIQTSHHHLHQIPLPHFDPTSSHDDFLQQLFSTVPSSSSWPELKPVDLSDETTPENNVSYHLNGATSLSSKAASATAMMLQHQLLMSRGVSVDSGLLHVPLCLTGGDIDGADSSSFKSANAGSDQGSVQALYNGFTGSLHVTGQNRNQTTPTQHFHNLQNFGTSGEATNQDPTSDLGGRVPAQPRQIRARRGQATDPHSIAERLRRERIAERMKALQELVPNANRTDKASMLDEIIDYVKFLQGQVKVLSLSRLSGASAVAPLVAANTSTEGNADCTQSKGKTGARSNGTQTPSGNDTMTTTEHRVAKLMEEDMGSAMQYLQGKGLCLMPISLATAISTATCHSRNPMMNPPNHNAHHPVIASNGDGPSSPSVSVLTVQSATLGNGVSDAAVKDAAFVSMS